MRVALDTSVLVAASVEGHRHEPRARVWLDAMVAGEVEGVVTTHGLAELWATLTALPIEPRVPAAQISDLVERLADTLNVLGLGMVDYRVAMQRCVSNQMRSGAIYDALHLVAAERAEADVFLTFNSRHFVALSREGGPRVLAPPDPPNLIRP